MNVIAINGSPRERGNTAVALDAMLAELAQAGVEGEIIRIGQDPIQGCTACGNCRRSGTGRCVFTADAVNDTAERVRAADGVILCAPTYYGGIPGAMKCFLDRLFYSASDAFTHKVGAVFTVVRRSGGVDVTRQLLNYLTLAQVVLPPTQYWPTVYGARPGEVLRDDEGMQTLRQSARAMAWLMQAVRNGQEQLPPPQGEQRVTTNFIR